MKKLFTFTLLLCLCSIGLLAQAPQAVCYQAVAKNSLGVDLVDQEITIRATIVKGSPNGLVEWQETHAVQTDQFGLFTLNVGEGDQTGGLQVDFKDIQWGNGVYWLRIEMDVSGGQNFAMMGATRIISVPYAFHSETSKEAEKADEATHAINADNATHAVNADNATHALTADNATNAVNANHALTADDATHATNADNATHALTADNATNADNANHALTADNATHALTADNATNAVNANHALTADTATYAVTAGNATHAVNADNATHANNANHALTADNATHATNADNATTAQTAATALDDMDKSPTNEIQSLTLVDGQLTISGGNTVDFNTNQMFAAPGANSDFPQGIMGQHVILLDQLYTVPNGKVLYVTAGAPNMKIQGTGLPGVGYSVHPTTPNMPIFGEGTQISECYCTAFLVPAIPTVTPVIINLSTTPGYSVPAGKTLFVKSGIPNDLPGRLIVDNQEMEFFRPNLTRGSRIVCFPENVLIKKPALYSELVLTGYLISD